MSLSTSGLVYHELGHLLLNRLIKKCVYLENGYAHFSEPQSILINLSSNTGEVTGAGFPNIGWNEKSLKEVSNNSSKLLHDYKYSLDFYKRYREFAIANTFLNISGFVVESFFERPEETKFSFFGKNSGERIDLANFKNIIGSVLDDIGEYDSSEKVVEYGDNIIKDIVSYLKNEDVRNLLENISAQILDLQFKEEIKIIDGDLNEIISQIDNCKSIKGFCDLINKY